MPIAVVTPVGPGAVDAERAWDNIRAFAAWEPEVRWVVLVDDGGPEDEGRDLAAIDVDGIEVVALPHPLGRAKVSLHERMASSALAGLAWAARNTDADPLMIIDTDALVIAPFADKLAAALQDPSVGLLGSFDRTCNGDERDFGSWSADVQRLTRIVQTPRRIALSGRARQVRQYVLEARAAGYEWGEHALGCALAIRRAALQPGVLDDPGLFLGTNLSYDPIMGIFVRRAGYRQAGLVADGDPFGLLWKGLPDTLDRLVERGFSIVHSTKNDPRHDEAEVRAYFQALRPGAAA